MPEHDAVSIIETIPYFVSYFNFVAIKNLGFNIDIGLFSFDKIVMWAWIKEFLDGRKT